MLSVTTEELVQLIQSLTSSERRYFRLNYAKTDSDYLRLYDLILREGGYNGEKTLTTFQRKNTRAYVRNLQQYLFQKILDALRSFYTASNPILKSLTTLEAIRVLEEKGIEEWKENEAKKLKKLVKTHELFSMMPFSIFLEFFNLNERFNTVAGEDIEETSKKWEDRVADLQNLFEVAKQSIYVENNLREWRVSKSALIDTIITDLPKGRTFAAQFLCYFVKSRVCYLKNNKMKFHQLLLAWISLCIENPVKFTRLFQGVEIRYLDLIFSYGTVNEPFHLTELMLNEFDRNEIVEKEKGLLKYLVQKRETTSSVIEGGRPCKKCNRSKLEERSTTRIVNQYRSY